MGWVFPASDTEEPGAGVDPFNGAKSIRELYEIASTNYAGKYTVPVCQFYLYHTFLSYSSILTFVYDLVGWCVILGSLGQKAKDNSEQREWGDHSYV